MNVAVLTFEFANPQAVADGCPKDWPYSINDIGTATELPRELSAPWKVMSRAELDASMKSMEASKETYNNREASDVTVRRQLIADIVADLRLIRQSSGTLTGAQMSNALRRIATALLIIIEEERVSLR
jgi:hypothetical protein